MENEWGLVTRDVSTKELDEMVVKYNSARLSYEGQKAISNDLHAHMESAKIELITLLQSAGKSKYEKEGVGKVNLIETLQVTTPKTLDEKRDLFKWLNGRFGEESIAFLSINHQTLNSLYNNELKESGANGVEFKIPGISLPTTNIELRFSKTK